MMSPSHMFVSSVSRVETSVFLEPKLRLERLSGSERLGKGVNILVLVL